MPAVSFFTLTVLFSLRSCRRSYFYPKWLKGTHFVHNYSNLISQCIIKSSSKTHFCFTLIHYGKPVISVYILDKAGYFSCEIAQVTRLCVSRQIYKQKLLQL